MESVLLLIDLVDSSLDGQMEIMKLLETGYKPTLGEVARWKDAHTIHKRKLAILRTKVVNVSKNRIVRSVQ